MIGNLHAPHGHRYELPLLSAPVDFNPRPVSVDPYELGSAAGRSAMEFVPEDYLFNSPDVRLAVLQGLLDSQHGSLTRPDRTCVEFTTSDRLRADVTFLVQSLGGTASEHRRSDASILDIRLPEGIVPFRHARNAAAYEASAGGRPRRFIDRIESAGTEEAVCIRVAAADSLYVTEDFLLTHNTLNDAFIVLDEAQNTTAEQMKMFLTRLGFGSKVVVTGDVTQIDLPGGAKSGLRAAVDILDDIDDIHIAQLTSADVVRHRLVGEIVDAYARYEENGSGMNRAERRASTARSRR